MDTYARGRDTTRREHFSEIIGDVWVSGSNKFKDFEDYLLPRDVWKEIRATGDPPVAVGTDPKAYVKDRVRRLHD